MAMDFFDSQDRAHRQSGLLIGYFAAAVLAIVLAINAVVFGALFAIQQQSDKGHRQRHHRAKSFPVDPIPVALVVTALTIGVIGLGSAYKSYQLAGGGAPVAMSLGGRRVTPGTRDPDERQLLNVVEEMAIASGCPVPAVYVLDEEDGINAFAAGNTPSDAVIGVTRGALRTFDRDELQGVIAHEFSHILNGDMRISLRLIGVLHGILMLATIGYYLMRATSGSRHSSNDRGGGAQLALVGLGVMVVGYIGVFFGRLIKSAVSRQREYLADASAVQFTRNPEGIGRALMKVGGYSRGGRMRSPEAEEASHLFFADGIMAASGSMATHPPIHKRIKAVLPDWKGEFPKVTLDDREKRDFDAQQRARKAERDARRQAKMAKLEKTPVGAMLGTVTMGAVGSSPAAGLGGITGSTALPMALTPVMALASVGAPGDEHVAFAEMLRASIPPQLEDELHDTFGACAVVCALLLDRDDEQIRGKQLTYLEQEGDKGLRREVERVLPHVIQMGQMGAIPLAELAMSALRDMNDDQYAAFKEHVHTLIMADDQVTLFELAIEKMIQRHLDGHFKPQKRKVKYPSIAGLADELSVLMSAASYLGGADPAEAEDAFAKAKDNLKLGDRLERLPAAMCGTEAISKALDKLVHAAPIIKKRTLGALTAAIAADEVVTVGEGELLRAVADALECPMPPLVGAPQEA